MPNLLVTLGHSNYAIVEFLNIVMAHRVELVADVRTVPKSRYNPQFNRDSLPASLAGVGVDYRHIPALGGLRHPRKDSRNTGWRNDSFRGYADHMQTPEFEHGVEELLALAENKKVAIMCAEAVPWRCHRSMIADALTTRGIEVRHIMSATKADPHKMTSFAKVEGVRVTYPPPVEELF